MCKRDDDKHVRVGIYLLPTQQFLPMKKTKSTLQWKIANSYICAKLLFYTKKHISITKLCLEIENTICAWCLRTTNVKRTRRRHRERKQNTNKMRKYRFNWGYIFHAALAHILCSVSVNMNSMYYTLPSFLFHVLFSWSEHTNTQQHTHIQNARLLCTDFMKFLYDFYWIFIILLLFFLIIMNTWPFLYTHNNMYFNSIIVFFIGNKIRFGWELFQIHTIACVLLICQWHREKKNKTTHKWFSNTAKRFL